MIRPLDVILTTIKEFDEPDEIASEIITAITGGPSHVRVYMKGWCENYDFWEVTLPHCRFGYMNEIDRTEVNVEIGRHKGLPYPLPLEVGQMALLEMKKLEGSDYDVFELWEHLLEVAGIDSTDNSDPNRYVCSSGAGHIMYWIGYPWHTKGEIVSLLSPQDIRESDEYEKVEEGGEI
jgi:hypothetical protein